MKRGRNLSSPYKSNTSKKINSGSTPTKPRKDSEPRPGTTFSRKSRPSAILPNKTKITKFTENKQTMNGEQFKGFFINTLKDPEGADAMRLVMKPLIEENTQNIANLIKIVKSQQDQIVTLTCEIDELKQQARNKILVISGVHEQQNENTETTVIELCKAIKVNLHPVDIDGVIRVGEETENKPRLIMLTVTTQKKKIQIMKEKKNLKKLDRQIYINESLTVKQSELFADSRKAFREKKIHATWTRDGRVYVKVKEQDNPKFIQNSLELYKLLK